LPPVRARGAMTASFSRWMLRQGIGKWSGTEVKLDGEELIIMKESDIMGVLEQGAAAKKVA
jgi:hypothetical protein